MKSKYLISILILLLAIQFVFSFVFPSNGDNENWLPPSAYSPKYSQEVSDNFILGKIIP